MPKFSGAYEIIKGNDNSLYDISESTNFNTLEYFYHLGKEKNIK